MTSKLRSHLMRATLSTFEDMGFVLPEPEVEEEQAAVPLAWRARVAFRGPCDGWLEIRATDDVVVALAANMLGVGNDVDATVKRDALGEIANVVCGNVVPALANPRAVFDLEPPACHETQAGPARSGARGVVLELGVDRGWVEIELAIEGGASEVSAA